MKDIITYIPDLEAFRAEAQACIDHVGDECERHPCFHVFTYSEEDGLTYNATKIPVVYKGSKSVCLVRVTDNHLHHLTTIERLGECVNGEYVFDSEEAKTKYESVYDTSTRMIDDGEGGSVEHTPSYKIGVFL